MTDVRLELSASGADFALADGDLVLDEGLETPLVVSLFSDRRVDPGDVLPEEVVGGEEDDLSASLTRDPRGFWADTPFDRWGSKLYLLSRAKAISTTAARAQEYAREALEWLKASGVAAAVEVEAEFLNLQRDNRERAKVLALELRVRRGASARWGPIWEAIESTEFVAGGVRIRLLAS